MTLLAIDVGNSNITVGLFDGSELRDHWRLQTVHERTADEYGLLLRQLLSASITSSSKLHLPQEAAPTPGNHSGVADNTTGCAGRLVDAVVIANVVPPLRPTMVEMVSRYFGLEALEISVGALPQMQVYYDPPSDVGADRLVNALAAFRQYGGPCIVIDFGTATTFDAISHDGCYLGGAIAPGIGISMEALFQRAARLPRVELRAPADPIGRTTVESMQSGFVYGFVGQVEEIVRRFREKLGPDTRTIGTGGLAELISRETRCIDEIDPWLTLQGMRMVWESGCHSVSSLPSHRRTR